MKLLLDTHTFIWFVEDHPSLSQSARELISEPEHVVFLSMASIWEMAIKISLGKLTINAPFDLFITNQLYANDIAILEIGVSHIVQVATLSFHHRDPFDRLLVAQSLTDGIPLVSVDSAFDAYGIQRLW